MIEWKGRKKIRKRNWWGVDIGSRSGENENKVFQQEAGNVTAKWENGKMEKWWKGIAFECCVRFPQGSPRTKLKCLMCGNPVFLLLSYHFGCLSVSPPVLSMAYRHIHPVTSLSPHFDPLLLTCICLSCKQMLLCGLTELEPETTYPWSLKVITSATVSRLSAAAA